MENRKKEHIDMAMLNRTTFIEKETKFVYEPLLSGRQVCKLHVVDWAVKITSLLPEV